MASRSDGGGQELAPRATIVIPVYNEGEGVVATLDALFARVSIPIEVVLVYDRPDDSTVGPIDAYRRRDPRVRGLLNAIGPGPAKAIRAGIGAARGAAVVVMMADGSDDAAAIEPMVGLVERGCAVVAASRYMRGGVQRGGPLVKRLLSRSAGLSLCWFARVGTHDATNSFKAYRRGFVEEVGIASEHGFEVAIELVAKARRLRAQVAEIPTVWSDRPDGRSNFKLLRWLPHYLRWYGYAFGPPLPAALIRAAAPRRPLGEAVRR